MCGRGLKRALWARLSRGGALVLVASAAAIALPIHAGAPMRMSWKGDAAFFLEVTALDDSTAPMVPSDDGRAMHASDVARDTDAIMLAGDRWACRRRLAV